MAAARVLLSSGPCQTMRNTWGMPATMPSTCDTGAQLRALYEPQGGTGQIFSSKVSEYIASRPDYPAALFDALRTECNLHPGAMVADVGAGTGLLFGSVAGAGAGDASAYELQQRYDSGYIQCMYAKGHKVPVSGRVMTESSMQGGYAPPPGRVQAPPPGGLAPLPPAGASPPPQRY